MPWTPEFAAIDAVHRRLPNLVANAAFVSADGLAHKGDKIHFDSASYRELGRRYGGGLAQVAIGRRGRRSGDGLREWKIVTLDPASRGRSPRRPRRPSPRGRSDDAVFVPSPVRRRGRSISGTHCRSRIHRESLPQPRCRPRSPRCRLREVRSLSELQAWIRRHAAGVPAGDVDRGARATRSRASPSSVFPTPEELDEGTRDIIPWSSSPSPRRCSHRGMEGARTRRSLRGRSPMGRLSGKTGVPC